MMKKILISLCLIVSWVCSYSNTEAIERLASRVTEGTSGGRIEFKIDNDGEAGMDFFKISAENGKVVIEGNNNISLATGLNHYLKYVAGIHLGWNHMSQPLPEILPIPESPVYMETDLKNRYYLNYCTFSYSMPFWDEDKWMKEIDWMALHGINIALSLTGVESVWRNLLRNYGYSDSEICEFIPGPAYMAWWLMNNLEGWGGPLPEEWFTRQTSLQQKIIGRMRELGISPVFPGYSGMVPRNFEEKTGHKVHDTGTWCGFPRPAFITPEDTTFFVIADSYYKELNDLYGESGYYAMDPFHEGGDIREINLSKAGKGIFEAMKKNNPDSKWVIQSWQENPRKEMLDSVTPGDVLILDLYSEKIPKWENIGGYGDHDWIYCMLLNFGGNVGMHGRFDNLIDNFSNAYSGQYSATLKGIGATPEGIENNPLMYELLFELPWRQGKIDRYTWLRDYLKARYGKTVDENLMSAWKTLLNTVYNAPADYPGEGTVESLICARPSLSPKSVSTWGNSTLFYSPDSTLKAKRLMEEVKDNYLPNINFLYDYTDVSRQSNADRANQMIKRIADFYNAGLKDSVAEISEKFLDLILEQDSLLSVVPSMSSRTWLDMATAAAGGKPDYEKLYRENAARLITLWGDSIASEKGGLHDYSHREWNGIIKELYYSRWKSFFEHILNGTPEPDYYQMELDWVRRKSEAKE